ncbi:MAG: AI-2E family transporter [Eubacteriales bacterium]|nr:AI-2E family transporter [Eubacteriales bacterium]
MRGKWDKNSIKFGIILSAALCVYALFSVLLKQWGAIQAVLDKIGKAIAPFLIGLVLAFLLNPIMIYIRNFLTMLSVKMFKKEYNEAYKTTKVPSLVLTIIFFLGLTVGFFFLVVPSISESIQDLMDNSSEYIENANTFIEKICSKNGHLKDALNNGMDFLDKNLKTIIDNKVMPNIDTIVLKVSNGVILGVKAAFNFLVGIVFAIYLLLSKHMLLAQCKKFIFLFFSKEKGTKILEGCSYVNSVFGGYINGKIIDSIIIGILCFIFTAAVHYKYAILISVIIGVTNIIPFFGPLFGAIPGALLALMDGPIYFIIFIIFVLVLQQFDGNILGPLILGDSTGLSGMWVLLAILVFGDLFGVAGMILGVPLFACIYALIALVLRDGLQRKNLSSNTEDYLLLEGFDADGNPTYKTKQDVRQTIKQRRMRLKTVMAEREKSKRATEELYEKDVYGDLSSFAKDDDLTEQTDSAPEKKDDK